ncbi:hypothetical protein AcW1_001158 [Taiwanofungus camphoratus]|nr:hypothetical protein AcV5_005071 [Antrodia cinnamomea]KAI0964312.1 hypothetical protein AcW1_001158 [Antrodia cinnamomea]
MIVSNQPTLRLTYPNNFERSVVRQADGSQMVTSPWEAGTHALIQRNSSKVAYSSSAHDSGYGGAPLADSPCDHGICRRFSCNSCVGSDA